MSRKAEYGFKGISVLRNELKQVLGDTEIIENDYHGNYKFVDGVVIGECAFDKLCELDDAVITSFVEELRRAPSTRPEV